MIKAGLFSLVLTMSVASAQAQSEEAKKPVKSKRLQEIAELEGMLKNIDTAIKELKPLVFPKYSYRQYDIRQLVIRHSDRIGPKLTVASDAAGFRTSKGAGGGGGGGGGVLSFDDAEEEPEYERCIDPDRLLELIRMRTGEDIWDEPASIHVSSVFLFVRQTEIVHKKIEEILTELKANIFRPIRYRISFYSVTRDQKKKLFSQNKRGLLSKEALANIDKALKEDPKAIVREAMMSTANGQRLYLQSGVEQTYVESYESSSGGTGQVVSVVGDPVIEVLRTGVVLDVRGTVVNVSDQEELSLDVRLRQSVLKSMQQLSSTWGVIDLPDISSESVRSAARIPNHTGMVVFSSGNKNNGVERETVVVIRVHADWIK